MMGAGLSVEVVRLGALFEGLRLLSKLCEVLHLLVRMKSPTMTQSRRHERIGREEAVCWAVSWVIKSRPCGSLCSLQSCK
jgi:hypothetical protein